MFLSFFVLYYLSVCKFIYFLIFFLMNLDAGVGVKSDDTYLGYDVWTPTPPKVKKPRSVFNAASLAYIGDCIYEVWSLVFSLFVFSHLFYKYCITYISVMCISVSIDTFNKE